MFAEIEKKHILLNGLSPEEVIAKLAEEKYYGMLQFNFDNGKITHGKKTDSLKF